MLINHEQLPNICDVCKKKDHLIHFHIETFDQFVAMCPECKVKFISTFFKTVDVKTMETVFNKCVETIGGSSER